MTVKCSTYLMALLFNHQIEQFIRDWQDVPGEKYSSTSTSTLPPGLNPEEAVGLIINGFCKEVLQQLPMEFAVEAQKLVGISLEGSVG